MGDEALAEEFSEAIETPEVPETTDHAVDVDPFIEQVEDWFKARAVTTDEEETPAEGTVEPLTVEPVEAPATPAPTEEAETPDASIEALAEIPPEEVDDFVSLYKWHKGLNKNQEEAITNTLSGEYVLVHKTYFDEDMNWKGPQSPASTTSTSSSSPSVPPSPSGGEDEYLDAALARKVQELEAKLSNIDSTAKRADEAVTQQRNQDVERQLTEAVTSAKTKFLERHTLSAEEMDELAKDTANLNIVPGIATRHPNDPVGAFDEALETALWALPKWREKAMQAQLDSLKTTDQEVQERKRRAAAVNSGGGSVARSDVPLKNLTPADREAAFVREIADAWNNGGG